MFGPAIHALADSSQGDRRLATTEGQIGPVKDPSELVPVCAKSAQGRDSPICRKLTGSSISLFPPETRQSPFGQKTPL